MKLILLASAACLALSYPAMAQNTPNGSQPSSQQQQSQSGTAGNPAQQQNGSQQQAANEQTIQPSRLSKEDIRDIQKNLDKAGFSTKGVDGIWGDETQAAVRHFQQAKHLPGDGQLNQQTLAALGVNISNQSQANSQNGQNSQQENASSGQNGSQNASSGQSGQSGQSQTVGQSSNPSSGNGQGSPQSSQNANPQNK
jgi:putative peptidoglycan binding protein